MRFFLPIAARWRRNGNGPPAGMDPQPPMPLPATPRPNPPAPQTSGPAQHEADRLRPLEDRGSPRRGVAERPITAGKAPGGAPGGAQGAAACLLEGAHGAPVEAVPPQRAPPVWEGGCSVANPGSRGGGHLHGAPGGARGRWWEVSVPPGGGGAGNGSSGPGRPRGALPGGSPG